MPLTIGELVTDVELAGTPAPPTRAPTATAGTPSWARREEHRATCRAAERDAARTATEDEDG